MKRPTEGNLYIAHWEKKLAGYTAWLEKRPKEKIQGRTEAELKEHLWDLALEHYGDGEACIELVPPLPATRVGARYFDPQWFKLGSNEGLLNPGGERADFFREGLCSFCKAGRGGRTKSPRTLTDIPRSDYAFIWGENPGTWIVTEAFLNFFGPLLGKTMSSLPCLTAKPSKKNFFELELTGTLRVVTHREGTHNEAWICPKCQVTRHSTFICEKIQKGLTSAVSRPALLDMKGVAHVLARPWWPGIMVNASTAARLRSSKLKGVLLDRVALLPKEEIGDFPLRKLRKKDL